MLFSVHRRRRLLNLNPRQVQRVRVEMLWPRSYNMHYAWFPEHGTCDGGSSAACIKVFIGGVVR